MDDNRTDAPIFARPRFSLRFLEGIRGNGLSCSYQPGPLPGSHRPLDWGTTSTPLLAAFVLESDSKEPSVTPSLQTDCIPPRRHRQKCVLSDVTGTKHRVHHAAAECSVFRSLRIRSRSSGSLRLVWHQSHAARFCRRYVVLDHSPRLRSRA